MGTQPAVTASRLADEADLRLLRERGDPAARTRLVERHLPLVRKLAWRYRRSGEPIEDLVQTGTVGLVQAINRFDPERGSSLLAYAVPTVVGEIRRHLRDHCGGPTVPRPVRELAAEVRRVGDDLAAALGRVPAITEVAEAVGADAEAVVEALLASNTRVSVPLPPESDEAREPGSAPVAALAVNDERYGLVEDRWAATQALRVLDRRERTIVVLSYFAGLSQAQIAVRLGISQMHVSRLLRRALTKSAAAAAAGLAAGAEA